MKVDYILPHKNKGFTLQELMLGMAIFFILAAFGVPGYIGYIRNGELSNTTTSLFADMNFARSEAIKRKAKVTICRSTDAMAANPVCGGASKTWSNGWIVFVDVSGAPNIYDGTDVLLKVGVPPSTNVEVISNVNADQFIEYNTDGSLNINLAPSVYAVCADFDQDGNFDEDTGRELRINPIGRPEIKVGAIASCDNPV
ncbi:MAG: GspH/FimT family pseudopilin [Thioalkalispiraceae bacterium]|jgi:type IV fimbrial biogenesis protein FimT